MTKAVINSRHLRQNMKLPHTLYLFVLRCAVSSCVRAAKLSEHEFSVHWRPPPPPSPPVAAAAPPPETLQLDSWSCLAPRLL